jgi:hypothetical protein
LEPEEAKLIAKHYDAIEPYMTQRGKKAVKDQGAKTVVDMDGELVTPIVQEYAECVYAKKDRKGIWMCGIEQAFNDGVIPFNKPKSCHLYPIRVEKLKYHDGLNYNTWDICSPACACGAKLDVPVFRFLKGCVDTRVRRGVVRGAGGDLCGVAEAEGTAFAAPPLRPMGAAGQWHHHGGRTRRG